MKLIYDNNASGDLTIRFEDTVSFDRIREILVNHWSAKTVEQLGTYDQGWLDLRVNQGTITLHSDTFMGLSLTSRDSRGEEVLRMICDHLKTIGE